MIPDINSIILDSNDRIPAPTKHHNAILCQCMGHYPPGNNYHFYIGLAVRLNANPAAISNSRSTVPNTITMINDKLTIEWICNFL